MLARDVLFPPGRARNTAGFITGCHRHGAEPTFEIGGLSFKGRYAAVRLVPWFPDARPFRFRDADARPRGVCGCGVRHVTVILKAAPHRGLSPAAAAGTRRGPARPSQGNHRDLAKASRPPPGRYRVPIDAHAGWHAASTSRPSPRFGSTAACRAVRMQRNRLISVPAPGRWDAGGGKNGTIIRSRRPARWDGDGPTTPGRPASRGLHEQPAAPVRGEG